MYEVAEISYGYVKDIKGYKEMKEHQYKIEKTSASVWQLQSGHNSRYMTNLPSGHCCLQPLEKDATTDLTISLISEFSFEEKVTEVVYHADLQEKYPLPADASEALTTAKDLMHTEVHMIGLNAKMLYATKTCFKGETSEDPLTKWFMLPNADGSVCFVTLDREKSLQTTDKADGSLTVANH